MQTLIMHKDICVARYDFDTQEYEVLEPEHMPVGVRSPKSILEWLDRRNIPASRPFSELIFQNWKLTRPADLAKISHNTSITDCYWFADEEEIKEGLKWKDVNPRNLEWSESGEALFVGHPEAVEDLESPDFAIGGFLPKVWVREPDNIFLLKRDGENGLNTFAEIAASEMATMLNVSHVPYFFSITAGEICTGCPCLIDSDEEELVPFSQILANGEDWQEAVEKFRVKGEFARMQVFDFLSGNWNRSLDDIALIRNPDTLEIYGMSPLYDHGNAFLYTDNDDEMRKMMKIAKANLYAMDADIDFVSFSDTMLRIADELEFEKAAILPYINLLESRIRIYKSFTR